jgi:histidinol-phosphate/aromatic aminotransferase/cobyric acid decarboxylase-like protein
MYGEYQHVLEHVIGAQVDRFHLSPDDHFTINTTDLQRTIARGYDMVLMVNPNNPTGRHLPREQLEPLINSIPRTTRRWIDETYTDYAGPDQSIEHLAAASDNLVICKSLSKVYALSGARAAYLCGPAPLIADLRKITPPWAVSLPAQIAAIAAMNDPAYYTRRWRETHNLRDQLAAQLRTLNFGVFEGVINSLLCRLPANAPSAHDLVMACRTQGIFIRDCSTISRTLAHRWIRIAVKDVSSNEKIVHALARSIMISQPTQAS